MHETTALLADMPSRCEKGQFSLYLISAKPMNVTVNTMGTMLLLNTVNFNKIHFSVLKNTHMKGKKREHFLNY